MKPAKAFHESLGSKKNTDGSIDLSNRKETDAILQAYNDKIASSEFALLGGSEVRVPVPGRKVWARTFIIDEGPE
jgi:hypothetical protein